MSNNNSSSSSGGIGFCGMLAILFIGLKLTHYIDWSWWWVLSPIWLPGLISIAIVLIFLIGAPVVGGLIGLFGGIFVSIISLIGDTFKDRRLRKYEQSMLEEPSPHKSGEVIKLGLSEDNKYEYQKKR